jgi:hypothetical protein
VTQHVIWNLPVPLDERALARSGPQPTLVQFAGSAIPTERDHRILGAFIEAQPTTTVRFYGAHLPPDLRWLHYYSAARRINLDVDGVTSLEPLRSLRPDLEELTLGSCLRRRISLIPLRHFTALHDLALVGHQRDIEVVAELQTLERLTLISIKLPALDVFKPLTALRAFALKLGGTTNLAALPGIGRLQYLEIWRVNGLTDVGIIAKLPDLEYLFLQHLKRVEQLPSLASCRRLRRVHLDRVDIADLGPIADAPHLEELRLLDMPQLTLDAFRPLLNHPALRAVTAGIRNERRRAQIRAMLGLDDVQMYGTDFRFTPLSTTDARHAAT